MLYYSTILFLVLHSLTTLAVGVGQQCGEPIVLCTRCPSSRSVRWWTVGGQQCRCALNYQHCPCYLPLSFSPAKVLLPLPHFGCILALKPNLNSKLSIKLLIESCTHSQGDFLSLSVSLNLWRLESTVLQYSPLSSI